MLFFIWIFSKSIDTIHGLVILVTVSTYNMEETNWLVQLHNNEKPRNMSYLILAIQVPFWKFCCINDVHFMTETSVNQDICM